MDLSTPWTPSLDGNVCATSHLYQLVQNDLPNSISNTPWAKRTLKEELAKTPAAQQALWESILALWRLNLTLKKTSENADWCTDWCNLVSAWLQRHRDICWQFNIAPYKVILDFSNVLRTNEALDVKIPTWDRPTTVPPSEPEQVPKQIRNPQPTKRRSEARVAASNARVNRDVEMVELAPRTTRSAQKRKQRAQFDDDYSISVEGSEMDQSDTRNTTPPQVQKRSKRPRATVVQARRKDGLDLSEWRVIEETRISQVLPMAEGKVCDQCLGAEQYCKPIWHNTKTTNPVCCVPCIYKGTNCSFKHTDWGVKVWPTLKPHLSSPTHRSRAERRMAQEKKATETRPTLFMQDILTPLTPIPKLRPLAPNPDIAAFISKNPSTSTLESLPLNSQLLMDKPNEAILALLSIRIGTSYNVWQEKYTAFEAALRDPKGTPLEARMMAAKVNAIRHRERWAVQGLIKMTEGRDALAVRLINHLLAKAAFLEGKAEETTEATCKDAEEDTERTFYRDDRDANIEVSRGNTEHVEDPLSFNRTAMVGVVQSVPGRDTEITLNRD